jgi:hypothetical protein
MMNLMVNSIDAMKEVEGTTGLSPSELFAIWFPKIILGAGGGARWK